MIDSTFNTDLIKHLYDRFNARDIDGVLAFVAGDVAWANGMDGGHVRGHAALREYWTRQWSTIDPRVDPLNIREAPDGSILTEVHQVVHDLSGQLLLDETVTHAFRIQNNRVLRFDIQSTSQLSRLKHEDQ
jgi:ketosteroid isomerase-like protein